MTQITQQTIVEQSSRVLRINMVIEAVMFFLLRAVALIIVGVLIAILCYIFANGYEHFNLEYLLTPPSGLPSEKDGILYPLLGTVYMVSASILVAAPIGIAAAIYLAEYAQKKSPIVKLARFAIDSLAGIPSIIYGLFGLAFFANLLRMDQSILAAALSVAIMILPFIIRTSEEAILTVPSSYRDASAALGANKVQTIFKVVLPAASPGIVTGLMLSVGRAIAESAIVILAAGGSITSAPRILAAAFPFLLPDSGRTLAVHLYYQATSYDEPSKSFATAAILVVLILILTTIAQFNMKRKPSFKR